MQVCLRPKYQDQDILYHPDLKTFFEIENAEGSRNYYIFLDWTEGMTPKEISRKWQLGDHTIDAILKKSRGYYDRIKEKENGKPSKDEPWHRFRMLLSRVAPDAKVQVITKIIKGFMNYYGPDCNPEISLLFATPMELMQIPGLLGYSMNLLLDAKKEIAKKYNSGMLWEVVKLKRLLYFVSGDERTPGIDRMVMWLRDKGITSIEDFTKYGAPLIAGAGCKKFDGYRETTDGDRHLIENAYRTAVRLVYDYVEDDPMTMIIWYRETGRIDTRPGVNAKDLKRIVSQLSKDGYSVGIGGRMPRSNIRIISVSKKGNNENE